MKRSTKHGKPVLVARSIKSINVYKAGTKEICYDFNYEDWSDICVGFNRLIRSYKQSKYHNKYVHNNELMAADYIRGLGLDRLIRASVLLWRALVPSKLTFHLVYSMIYKQDFNQQTAAVKSIDELTAKADKAMIKDWHQLNIENFIGPLLEKIMHRIFELGPRCHAGWYGVMSVEYEDFIGNLKQEAMQLPIYQTDFKGILINGLIYHDPDPTPFVVREAYWEGGHIVTGIHSSQICGQGGSFGPVCLWYLDKHMANFRSSKGLHND